MISKLYSCLWYNGNAKEAAALYCSIFKNAKILSENQLVTMIDIDGSKIKLLNGGPHYKHTPAISQFVTSEDDAEIEHLFNNLSKDGKILMALGKYDWSAYYGWCEDKFGVSWQIYKGKISDVKQKVVPCFLFVGDSFGKAEEAQNYYMSVITNSNSEGILKYQNTNTPIDGAVMHSQFRLNDAVFMAMDGPGEHHYTFSPASSFVIECETQDEIDYYWEKLGEGGKYNKCGWLDDKFGITWQVVPKVLGQLMSNPEKAPKVVETFMKMSKFDIEALLKA